MNLGHRSPGASCGLPGSRVGPTHRFPIWPCSTRGLPSYRGRPRHWWALTPPFHPYRRLESRRRSVLCGTFPGFPPLGVTQRAALWSPDFPLPIVSTAVPLPRGSIPHSISQDSRPASLSNRYSSPNPPLPETRQFCDVPTLELTNARNSVVTIVELAK